MRVLVVTTGNPDRLTGGYLYIKRVIEGLEDSGYTVTLLSLQALRFPWSLASAWRLARHLNALNPDVVLVDAGMAGITAAPLLLFPRLSKPPIAALLLQAPRDKTNSVTVTRLLEGFLLRHAAGVIVPSCWMINALQHVGVRRERVSVVMPGCDIPGLEHSMKTSTHEGTRFLCVANWLPGKGIEDLVQAFNRCKGASRRLDLVGDQTVDRIYSKRIHRLIAQLGLESSVEAPGVVPWEMMPKYYQQADVLVLPSYSEGLPLSCCEAYHYGLPVVGYKIPALEEIVSDGVDGMLVPPGDVAALSDTIVLLADDQAFLARLSCAARSKGSTLPTWHESGQRFRAALGRFVRFSANCTKGQNRHFV